MDSCPGPTTIATDIYGTIALSSSATYSANLDCSVVITNMVANSNFIKLTAQPFSTESDADILTVFDGDSVSSTLLFTLSGTTTQDITSNGRKLGGCLVQ